ncbi:MAG: inositol monophosphatase [Puniceicoccales bacterium]|jgi:myo-inositol-1(or 4)-monophosphatase|nr:inositol monophosphatase [Puniceicoccales bacterium]
MIEISAYHKLALSAAAAAAQVLHDGANRTVNFLSPQDVKLQADEDSEKLIRRMLAETGLPIIGEELGGDPGLFEGNQLYWVVDPLDGTYNYLRNQPATCVSIGLMRGSEPVSGVIHDFCGDRVYAGVVGTGVTINGVSLQPSWADSLDQACLMTGFPAATDKSPEALAQFVEQVRRFKKIRMIGSAALAVAYVGTGQADVYYETATNLWDIAAGMAIVRAAGGVIDLQPTGKKPLNFNLWAAGKQEWIGARK